MDAANLEISDTKATQQNDVNSNLEPIKTASLLKEGAKNGSPKFLVVGIGASAGGVPALQDFFAHLPVTSDKGTDIAFVVVTHLSPNHESNLVPIIQTQTALPVIQVNEPVLVKPDMVYVIPPGKQLSMDDGHFRLLDLEQSRSRRAPIDLFFRTLAQTHTDSAAVIVLSGSGSDGSIGLPRVKEMGGVTLAQNPEEAEYNQMPNNAIATGFVDQILPVTEMGQWLLEYNQNRRKIDLQVPAIEALDTDAETEALAISEESEQASNPKSQGIKIDKQDIFLEILAFLRVRTGHNFALYKRATLNRRVERRMQINSVTDLPGYLEFLGGHPNEVQALLRDLLISVTNFFRDKPVWDYLETNIIPGIFKDKEGPDVTVRVWVAGCATGEEAYSMAILLHEYASRLASPPRLQIFASDLDERAIAVAREGTFPETISLDVSSERLRRFFTQHGRHFRVNKDIRDTILFASHDLLKDPPFSRLDLISCRNLLIYLNKDGQEQLFNLFHFALKSNGYLLLGTSESADGVSQLFSSVDKKMHLYLSRPDLLITQPSLVLPLPTRTPLTLQLPNLSQLLSREKPILTEDLQLQLNDFYSRAGVVVDENFNIVHLSNKAGRFLQFSGGDFTNNLLRLVHPDLRFELHGKLYQSNQYNKTLKSRWIHINIGGKDLLVRLLVRPIVDPLSLLGYTLIIFDEEEIEETEGEPQFGEGLDTLALSIDARRDVEAFTRQLENDVTLLKAQLQTTIEQHGTSIEELKASNEELQAINEEYRSATEELETSKEELQAVNEELLTVNQELKVKIDEIGHANSDLQNLMFSTDIATIFLDRRLRLKRYTPRVERLFNVILTDIDRPLAHITHRLDYANLANDTEIVLRDLVPISREIKTLDNEWYLVRVLPYRTLEDRIDGVVLTFVDITERKQNEEKLAYQASLLEFTQEAVIAFNSKEEITFWNPGAEQMYGWKMDEVLGRSAGEILGDIAGTSNEDKPVIVPGGKKSLIPAEVMPGESRQARKDGTFFWVESSSRAFYDKEQRLAGYIAVLRDITGRKMADQALKESENRFRTVAELVPDLLWRLDVQGQCDWVNRSWLEYTGQSWEEALELGWMDSFHPEDREKAAVNFRQAIKKGRPSRSEYRIKNQAGDYRWYLAQTLPVKNETGEIVQWLGAASDVHEQRLAQEKLEARVQERTAELKQLNVSLKEEQNRLAELSSRLLAVQETERRFIARELHDEIGQDLTGLKFILETAHRQPAEEKDRQLSNALNVMNNLTRQVSELSLRLRPSVLDDLGLLPALLWHIQRYTEQTGITVDFRHKGLGKRLPSGIETTIYRLIQEALTNVARHAEVDKATVQVVADEQITVLVEDAGKGFDVNQILAKHNSTGVSGMQERVELVGGQFTVESSPGRGTTIIIEIPYNKNNRLRNEPGD